VVGIRYQYPLTASATSPTSYRRFQVNFASASDAAQFIEAISPVCPCKENTSPPPPQVPTNKPPMATSGSIRAPSVHAPLVRSQTSAPRLPSMPPPSSGANHTIEYGHHSYRSVKDVPTQKARDYPPPSSSELSLAPPSSPANLHTNPGFDGCSQRSSGLPEMNSSQLAAQAVRHACTSSLSTSSQPTSSALTLAPPPPSASYGPEEKTREAFLESLREMPELYSLTRPELENLVSVVIREPGFPRLVRCPFPVLASSFSPSLCSVPRAERLAPSARSTGLDVGHPRIFRAVSRRKSGSNSPSVDSLQTTHSVMSGMAWNTTPHQARGNGSQNHRIVTFRFPFARVQG